LRVPHGHALPMPVMMMLNPRRARMGRLEQYAADNPSSSIRLTWPVRNPGGVGDDTEEA